MKTVFLVLTLLTCIAQAKSKFDHIVTLDKPGTAYFLREGQTAAVIVTDGAAAELRKSLMSRQTNAPLQCGEGYCVIGQFTRDARIAPFAGPFADPKFFSKFMSERADPSSMVSADYYEDFGAKAYAYPSQCQGPDRKLIPGEEFGFKGRVAEQLYNFLKVHEGAGERVIGNGKYGHANSFFCEKIPKHDYNDYSSNGEPLPGAPASYNEYECYFKFSNDGFLQGRRECRIYGSAISAGGNQ